ncbi:MAG TPA: SRPBCC domain-containing protein [Bacteroidia bacterium]|nr:SRPBCC domain-containing protein [Bacteroidia bacterium]HRH09437.1 SRPBCC domain-containing protein [Bacteroidia bacterium]
MQTLQFTININASTQKVWKCLWDLENYKKWTSAFIEGSYYKTDSFTEGNMIHLLAPNGEGMYSLLEKIDAPNYLAFKHLGELKHFEEQINTHASWTNAIESYRLLAVENGTLLKVEVDTLEEYVDFMNKLFPLALQKLKKLAES